MPSTTMAEDTIARVLQHIPCEPQPVPRSGKRCKADFQLLHFADRAPVLLLLASHGSRSALIHRSLAAGPRPTCPAVRSSFSFNASLSVSGPSATPVTTAAANFRRCPSHLSHLRSRQSPARQEAPTG